MWAWSEKEEITEVEKSNGTKEKVGLKFNGNTATIAGDAEIKAKGPNITVSQTKVIIEKAELKKVFFGKFIFTNHGPGPWTKPIVGVLGRSETTVGGARFLAPTNTCTPNATLENGTCEVTLELEPTMKGTYTHQVGLDGAPNIQLEVKTS